MIDSIFVATSGMQGHELGLKVISNNIANMNTPGFRGSTVSFADVFTGAAPNGRFVGQGLGGGGLDASRTALDARRGDPQNTGNPLDLFLKGDGFFVLQDDTGAIRYTRNGHFSFQDGVLLDSSQKLKVMARNASGQLVPVELQNLQNSAAKVTTEVTFKGNLSPDSIGSGTGSDTEKTKTIESLDVFDQHGGKHTLRIKFTKDTDALLPGVTANWKITVFEGETPIGTADLPFSGPFVQPGVSPLALTLALSGVGLTEIAFKFDTDVTGQEQGSTAQSDLAVAAQDGFAAGVISAQTFDEKGVLKLTYSNGQKVDGLKLAIAKIVDEDALLQLGDATFAYKGALPVTLDEAGDEVQVISKTLELSNVDLTQEFSELILMQRGFQASSQVVSTANDMLQLLFDMRGRR